MDNILNSDRHDEDTLENSLRPHTLKEFQGQQTIKENLSVFVEASRNRQESLDHVFLSGPPGLGKTTLAQVIAHEMGADFKVTSAPALDKPKDLAGILTTITESTVFFIDEIHRLKPALEEMLYIAMEDYEMDWVIGQGPAARSIRIPIPPFTLIGATTKAGNVASPLISRFGISFRFNLYDFEDIKKVIYRSCGILNISMDDDAVDILSGCARGTPRIANRLLRRVRDYADVLNDGIVNAEVVRTAMKRLGIDTVGLENHDRELLKTIAEKFSGGPVGAETLAISIGESVDTLEDYFEPFLIQQGYIQRTQRGRIITERGLQHLGLPRKEKKELSEDQRFLF